MTKKSDAPAIRFKGFSDAWEQRKLGEMMNVTSVKRIHQSDWTDSGVRFLRARDIVAAAKNEEPDDYLYISKEKYEEYSALSGKVGVSDLLVTGVGTIGVPYLVRNLEPLYFKDGNIIWFQNSGKIDGKFLFYSFSAEQIQGFINESAGIGTVGTYTIESGKKTPISLPNQIEQARVGEFFQQLDNLITLHQRKFEKLTNVKKSMLEKMFPQNGSSYPEIRFKGFTDPWEQRKAKELFISTADKGYPDLPVLSATQDRGMIRRDENSINIFHDKKNEAGYKRVLPGQFVIHLRSFQGGFAHSTIEGITSPAYTVFGFSEPEKHDSEYWKYVFTSKAFIRRLETVTYGIRDGRSISYDEFLTLGFAYPSKAEQTAIARYLDKLSDLITLHQRELEMLQNIKKSMLEKMFV
jgi:type I restriction enzyme S subunit